MTRRTFSHLMAALPAAAQNSGSAPRPQLCIFSKHMAALDWKQLGPVVAKYRDLIDAEVKADTRKLEPYEDFVRYTADAAPKAHGHA